MRSCARSNAVKVCYVYYTPAVTSCITVALRGCRCAVVQLQMYTAEKDVITSKANAVEGGTTSAEWIYHQRNQATHVTDGVTVASLSANLKHKTTAARDRLCEIAFNRKISCKFEKRSKFSSRFKAKSRKTRPFCSLRCTHSTPYAKHNFT